MVADRADVELLGHLETRLKLVQTVGPGQDKIRFSLDLLAEYLAGLYLVGSYGDNDELWRQFLEDADRKEGAPASIRGFLLAVRDCCLTEDGRRTVPSFVPAALAAKADPGSHAA